MPDGIDALRAQKSTIIAARKEIESAAENPVFEAPIKGCETPELPLGLMRLTRATSRGVIALLRRDEWHLDGMIEATRGRRAALLAFLVRLAAFVAAGVVGGIIARLQLGG